MHAYETSVLKALKEKRNSTFEELLSDSGISKDAAMWALESLSANGMVDISRSTSNVISLTAEWDEYALKNLPEMQLLIMLKKKNIAVRDLGKKEMIGFQWAKKKGFADIYGGIISLTSSGKKVDEDKYEEFIALKSIKSGMYDVSSDIIDELVKRGLVAIKKSSAIGSISITEKGMHAKVEMGNGEIDVVTRGIIKNREWEGRHFKKYDVGLDVEQVYPARFHPLKEIISGLKDAYASLGFSEISGKIIEPSFWVHDALMIPQDHPARDVQDTFYLETPSKLQIGNDAIVNRVGEEHEAAWHGIWSREVSGQALLRTHMTSVTARFLYGMEKIKAAELPIKAFSVGRVFRNETVDYRHLADFYQSDGIIVGDKLTLANLFDVLSKLFGQMGFKVRFMPTYFPFVEPGVEIQAYYKERDEWLEIGGAGILRHEIIRAAGKKTTALAWGIGVDRIALMRNSKIKSVAELYNNGIGWIRRL